MIRRRRRQCGFVLPAVLVIIGMMIVAMAGFVQFSRAELAGTAAYVDTQQARLAADSGLEEVIALLRIEQHNAAAWFNVPQRFRHALVWSEAYDREGDPIRETTSRAEILEDPNPPRAWRYSIVGRSVSGLERTMRYGITPESGKLDLNAANEDQIRALLTPILADLGIETPDTLVDALLDWRDADDEVRDNGAENEFYNTLEPPYNCKNGRFDTVEELLLVRDFTAAVLYGEDVNRNGILDPNEDDGEETFPFYDNADGVLNPGIAPFLTVWAREPDVTLSNQPRINLNADAGQISAQIDEYFPEDELSGPTVAFLTNLQGQGVNLRQLRSVAELYTGADLEEPLDAAGEGGEPTSQPAFNSPITIDELPFLLDGFTIRPPQVQQQPQAGLININTAAAPVLRLIPGLTEEQVGLIVATRPTLEAPLLRTPAWLLSTGVVDLATLHEIAPFVTTKAYQMHVEALGYGDHLRLVRRYEWIIEMIGPLAQTRYYRDLTPLGRAWPIDDDELLEGTLGGG